MKTFSEYILEVSTDYQIEKCYSKIKELSLVNTEEAKKQIEIIKDKINLLVNKN